MPNYIYIKQHTKCMTPLENFILSGECAGDHFTMCTVVTTSHTHTHTQIHGVNRVVIRLIKTDVILATYTLGCVPHMHMQKCSFNVQLWTTHMRMGIEVVSTITTSYNLHAGDNIMSCPLWREKNNNFKDTQQSVDQSFCAKQGR